MKNNFSMLGNSTLWSLHKTAFFCSDKFSAGSVLKCYDWASEMKRHGQCVISGFQSKLEKDVFDLLIDGMQPIIVALACSLYIKPPTKLKSHIDAGRLLLISPFASGIGRPNRSLAFRRNQFIVDHADEVVFAHIHTGGMLGKLTLRPGLTVRVLDKECI
jgi:predicted Rossmann fold nucleotide-binding protein DprA/Smf involved in DNA uptake